MQKVTINDIEIIDKFYKKSNSTLGYNSFIGTYSACLGHGIELYYEIINEDIFCFITADSETKEKYVSPLFLGENPSKGVLALKEYCQKNKIQSGTYIDNNLVEHLKPFFNIKPSDEAEHEAIYPIERFSKFHRVDSQKRRANIFFREHNNYQLIPYCKNYQAEVMTLAYHWENNSEHPTENCDITITKYFTDNFENIPIQCFLLFVKNKLVAYLFGELINNRTFIFNIVKANRELKGVYQALHSLVCNHEYLKNVDFINGTNLTNVSGLRESKLRLKPSRFAVPWEFSLNS